MPSPHRRPRLQARGRITPEAVEAFRAGDWHRLYNALDLRPWLINPLDVAADDDPPSWSTGVHRENYLKAIAWRRELEDAVAT